MQEIKRPARRLIILWLAERMPLILQPEPLDAWLDPDKHDNETLQAMIAPCSAEGMSVYPVSPAINSGRVRFRKALSQ